MEINLTQRTKSLIVLAVGIPLCGLVCWAVLATLFMSPLMTPQTTIQFGNTAVDKTLVLFASVKLLWFISYVWFVVVGFKTRICWGILNLLMPVAAIFFTFNHFQKAKKPAIVWVAGLTLLFMALVKTGTK